MGFSGVVQQIKDLVTRVTNLDNSLIDRIYPVGSIYMSMVSTNPATLLGGGTWEQLPTGRCIIGANGTDYNAGDTGGSANRTLTVANLPAHTHNNTLAAGGGHSHTRGSMEITGKATFINSDGVDKTNYPDTGAFWWGDYKYSKVLASNSGTGKRDLFFTASKSWAGSTNTVANHNHTLTNASVGSGTSFSIVQPYVAVYIWKRTA